MSTGRAVSNNGPTGSVVNRTTEIGLGYSGSEILGDAGGVRHLNCERSSLSITNVYKWNTNIIKGDGASTLQTADGNDQQAEEHSYFVFRSKS